MLSFCFAFLGNHHLKKSCMVLVFILRISPPNAKKSSGNSNKLASFKKGIQYTRQQNVENLGIILIMEEMLLAL